MATTVPAAQRNKATKKTIGLGPLGPWHESAPRAIRKAYPAIGSPKGWSEWRKHLARRKLAPLVALVPGRRPLRWALPAGHWEPALELMTALEGLGKRERRELPTIAHLAATWLSGAPSAPPVASFAVECLAWTHALPQLAEQLSESMWWALATQLTAIASQETAGHDPLASQLLWGELPLTLAYQLGEIEACGNLAEVGQRTLEEGFAELLDGEGLIHAKYLPILRPLVACWTRAKALGGQLSSGSWSEEADTQYRLLVRNALRLSRPNGRPVFSTDQAPRWKPSLLKALGRAADDRQTRQFIDAAAGQAPGSKLNAQHPLWPSREGEWSALAAMRTSWRHSAAQLNVVYPERQVRCELTLGKTCLWSGAWQAEVRVEGKTLDSTGAWSQVCWESNEAVDYLELELPLSEEVTLQRHLLLARQERFLFLADAVVGITPGAIEYRGTLPIGGFSTFEGQAETREGNLLVAGAARARVLPLALNEWRAGPGQGGLKATERGLELEQASAGQSLFCPLFVDLAPGRLKKEVTWRQLTVASARTIVPHDDAVGYRVQVGRQQWLFYRSLAAPAIRTVLGQNLMHDLYVARFYGEEKVDSLIEIE